MVQVTDAAFKSLKVKSPSLIYVNQTMDSGVLANQTFLIKNGYLPEEKVPTFFPFPEA